MYKLLILMCFFAPSLAHAGGRVLFTSYFYSAKDAVKMFGTNILKEPPFEDFENAVLDGRIPSIRVQSVLKNIGNDTVSITEFGQQHRNSLTKAVALDWIHPPLNLETIQNNKSRIPASASIEKSVAEKLFQIHQKQHKKVWFFPVNIEQTVGQLSEESQYELNNIAVEYKPKSGCGKSANKGQFLLEVQAIKD